MVISIFLGIPSKIDNFYSIYLLFSEFNLELDPKDLCPLLELVDKTFCKSGKGVRVGKENVDPKDLCPLLELIDTKLCS